MRSRDPSDSDPGDHVTAPFGIASTYAIKLDRDMEMHAISALRISGRFAPVTGFLAGGLVATFDALPLTMSAEMPAVPAFMRRHVCWTR